MPGCLFIVIFMFMFPFVTILSYSPTNYDTYYPIIKEAELSFQETTGEIAFGRLEKDSVAYQLLEPYLDPNEANKIIAYNFEVIPDKENIYGFSVKGGSIGFWDYLKENRFTLLTRGISCSILAFVVLCIIM